MSRRYLPDFVVLLGSGDYLLVEIKGQIGDALLKKAAAERRCRAVTNHGGFGHWTDALCFGACELRVLLDGIGRLAE